MMENQTQSIQDLHERIKAGDVEAARELTSLPTEAFVTLEPVVEEVALEAPEQELGQPDDPQVSEGETSSPEASETDINPLEEHRLASDLVQKENLAEQERLKEELAKAQQQTQDLLKQAEIARKEADERLAKEEESREFDIFGEHTTEASDPVTVETDIPDEQPSAPQSDELAVKLEELRRRMDEEAYVKGRDRDLNRFWSSDEGKALRPTGKDAGEALQELDTFYDKLAGSLGSDSNAKRAMYDLRNPGTSEGYKTKLEQAEISVPEGFDKLYDTWAVMRYQEGYKLDPVTGKEVQVRQPLESIDEAYFLMNKDELLFKERMKTFTEVSNKRNEHIMAATPIPATHASAISTSGNIEDPAYRMQAFKMMKEEGITMDRLDRASSIADPAKREIAMEMASLLKQN